MTKMYGSMRGDELLQLVSEIEQQIESDPTQANNFAVVPKDTLVALVQDLKDAMNRRFFYELGKTFRLMENQQSAKTMVPPRYEADFEMGVRERQLAEVSEEKCNACRFKVAAVRTLRGRVFVTSRQNKEKIRENDS